MMKIKKNGLKFNREFHTPRASITQFLESLSSPSARGISTTEIDFPLELAAPGGFVGLCAALLVIN